MLFLHFDEQLVDGNHLLSVFPLKKVIPAQIVAEEQIKDKAENGNKEEHQEPGPGGACIPAFPKDHNDCQKRI